LDEVHLTSYDIKEVISGKALWDQDRGDLEDKEADDISGDAVERQLDKMADYSDLTLEELLERMEQVMKEQRAKHSVQTLFKKMKVRFAHDLETYYFHNTIYDIVFSDANRRKVVPIDRILTKDPNYRVFFIGDASMAAYELNRTSLNTYRAMKKHFSKIAWLNPEPKKYWPHTFTIKFQIVIYMP